MTRKKFVEQRRHARVPLGVSMEFNVRCQATPKCQGMISDLSPAGMTLKTEADFEEGMTLHLRVSPTLQIRVQVRNVTDVPGGLRRYGVRFHKIGLIPIQH